jgi:hypothetical protein
MIALAPGQGDMRLKDYSNIQRPRQETTKLVYQDRTQASSPAELLTRAHQAAEYNKQINSQRNRSHEYLDRRWRQPHEAPLSNIAPQPVGTDGRNHEYLDRHWRQPEQKVHKLPSTHGMEEIREVILQHLTSSPVPGLDNQSHLQVEATDAMGPEDPRLTESHRFKAMFSVEWELKQFMKEQFGEACARPMGSVIALTGSALCAQATTVQEYLKRHWPYTGLVLLETLEKALTSGISTLSQGKHIPFPQHF